MGTAPSPVRGAASVARVEAIIASTRWAQRSSGAGLADRVARGGATSLGDLAWTLQVETDRAHPHRLPIAHPCGAFRDATPSPEPTP